MGQCKISLGASSRSKNNQYFYYMNGNFTNFVSLNRFEGRVLE